MSGHYRKEKNCLNCGYHVEEHYCSRCGQPNLELREPFWGFLAHSIGHYFHFDSKFFHTLVPLLTKPGQVTLDYLAGKRARYIHPVSLYIFVSIIYFLIVPHAIERNETDKKGKTPEEALKSEITREPIAGTAKNTPLKQAFEKKDFRRLSYLNQTRYLDSLIKLNTLKKSDSLNSVIAGFNEVNIERQDSTYASYLGRQRTLPEEDQDSWLVRQTNRWVIEANNAPPQEKPKFDIKEELKKYAPKQYFLLMPLLAFFIMLNFRKNRIYYIDHLVFTIHGTTAYFIIAILSKPVVKYVFGFGSFMSEIIEIAVAVGIIWYLYTGLKRFYNRPKWVTIRKMITLTILYALAVLIAREILEMIITHLLH